MNSQTKLEEIIKDVVESVSSKINTKLEESELEILKKELFQLTTKVLCEQKHELYHLITKKSFIINTPDNGRKILYDINSDEFFNNL